MYTFHSLHVDIKWKGRSSEHYSGVFITFVLCFFSVNMANTRFHFYFIFIHFYKVPELTHMPKKETWRPLKYMFMAEFRS